MSGTGNGNGNGNPDQDTSPLDAVVTRLTERQAAEAANPDPSDDPVYGWKQIPVGGPVTLEQLHSGLMAVSQISEAAIEGGIKMAADLKVVLPVLEQLTGHLQELMTELRTVQNTLVSFKRDIQALKDDTRDLADKVHLVPAIKSMLADVLVRLPDSTP